MLLGHSHPAVVEAVGTAAAPRLDLAFLLNEPIIELAEEIVKRGPGAEQVRTCRADRRRRSSRSAWRARSASGTSIMKFEGGFHGTHDYALMSVSAPLAEGVLRRRWLTRPACRTRSGGGPDRAVQRSGHHRGAHRRAPQRAGRGDRRALPAVIVPAPGFLRGLRAVTPLRRAARLRRDRHRLPARLRRRPGILRRRAGLAAFGKVLAGGFPLAAWPAERRSCALRRRAGGHPDYVWQAGDLQRQSHGGRGRPGHAGRAPQARHVRGCSQPARGCETGWRRRPKHGMPRR